MCVYININIIIIIILLLSSKLISAHAFYNRRVKFIYIFSEDFQEDCPHDLNTPTCFEKSFDLQLLSHAIRRTQLNLITTVKT